MNKLLEENHNNEKHGYLKPYCDGFGNEIESPEGFRILKNEKIKKGDIYFDIYLGWIFNAEAYAVKNSHYSKSEGRWRAWARRI
jgi:hypothetical protein